MTCGDPIGPPDDFKASLIAFKNYCSANDWLPAFYQVLPDHLNIYRELGNDALCIGQEAVVDVSTFTLAGGENKTLRTTMNKFNRLGYSTKIIEPPLEQYLLQALRTISDEWLTKWNTTEMRFATGWFDDDYIRTSRVIVGYDNENNPVAFANLMPEYQLNEITVDLMRYHNRAESGIMDFLFVSLLQWAKDNGYTSFSLGLSALASVGESPEDPAIERALHYIFEHVDSIYHFKGLHAFKEKYHPRWLPRYLVYPGSASLALVTIAIILADTGYDVLGWYLRHR